MDAAGALTSPADRGRADDPGHHRPWRRTRHGRAVGAGPAVWAPVRLRRRGRDVLRDRDPRLPDHRVHAGHLHPFALVLLERWRCKHSFINGQQLVFTGSAVGLFGLWIKWFLLMIITLGIYGFWVGPRISRWKWENTGFVGHVVARPA